MSDTFVLYDFIMECFAFPYSKDYFEIMTEGYEYQLYCQYQENAIVKEYTEEYLAENGMTLDEDYFQEDQYFSEAVEAKSSSFFSKAWAVLQKAWKHFYLTMMRVFRGQKISLNTKDPKTFRDTLKNTLWTNELILKMLDTEKKFDEDFWSQQPLSTSDKDIAGLSFAGEVSGIRRQNFKKFCSYILSDKKIRLNARSMLSRSSANKEQQQNINSASAKSGARAASVNGISEFFSDICEAESLDQFNAAREKLKKDQDDVEKNGFPISRDPAEIEKQESLLKRINEQVSKFIGNFKKNKLSGADKQGKVDVTLANGKTKKFDPDEAKEFAKWCMDGVKELLPIIPLALGVYAGNAALDILKQKINKKINGDEDDKDKKKDKKNEDKKDNSKEDEQIDPITRNLKGLDSDALVGGLRNIDKNILNMRNKFTYGQNLSDADRQQLYENIVKQCNTRSKYLAELKTPTRKNGPQYHPSDKTLQAFDGIGDKALVKMYEEYIDGLDALQKDKNNYSESEYQENLVNNLVMLAQMDSELKRRRVPHSQYYYP